MPTNRKLRVFLCHASQDKPVVRELYQRLLAENWIDPWLDEEKLLPGQDWDMEIEKAVEATDAVIVCLSHNSVTKEGYIQRELKFVLDIALEKPEGVIFVIPLRLNECQVPRRLRGWQYVDYFPTAQKKKSYQRVVESLKLRDEKIEYRGLGKRETRISHHPTLFDQAISYINQNEFVTVKMLSERLNIQAPKAARLLSELTKRGLILVAVDKSGSRKYSLSRRGVAYDD